MEDKIKQALENDQWIDITTLGRKTGQHRRIELGIHLIDGEYYITGTPGKRGWYANMIANPQFTVHLKESMAASLRAEATPIRDEEVRRAVFAKLVIEMGRGEEQVAEWVADSALVRVKFLDP